jgi:hypothetical protein
VANGRPKRIADVLSEVMARRGYARVEASDRLERAWCAAAGELAAQHTRVGAVRRGVLEVVVGHSALVQEITFQKSSILSQLARLAPDERIADLRLRVGPIQ